MLCLMHRPLLTLNLDWRPLALCTFGPNERVPAWAWDGDFCEVSREGERVWVLCDARAVPAGSARGVAMCGIQLELPDGMTEHENLATVSRLMTAAGVSAREVGADVVVVPKDQVERAVRALERAGYRVEL